MSMELDDDNNEQVENEDIQSTITEFINMDVSDSNYDKFKNNYFNSESHIRANYKNYHEYYLKKLNEIKKLIDENSAVKEALQSTSQTSVVPKKIYDKKDEQVEYLTILNGHLINGFRMASSGLRKMFKIYDVNDSIKIQSSALKQLRDMIKDMYTIMKEQSKLTQDFQTSLQQENIKHINNLFNEVKTSNENNTRLMVKAIENISNINQSNNRRERNNNNYINDDEDKNNSFRDSVISKPIIEEPTNKEIIVDKPQIKQDSISNMEIDDIPKIESVKKVIKKEEPEIDSSKINEVEEKKDKIITEKDVKFKLPEIPNFGDESGVGTL